MTLTQDHLVFIACRLNGEVSSGKYHDVSVQTVKERVADGTILSFIAKELGIDLYRGLEPTEENTADLIEVWQQIENYRHPSEVYIKEDGNGLCLLIAFTLEAIQEISTG